MQIGLIGTDSSHAVAFSRLLLAKGHTVRAFQGGSTIAMSKERIVKFTEQLRAMNVPFVNTMAELLACDAFIITSVDASQHLEQLAQIVQTQKPVFIDKPLAPTPQQATQIVQLAEQHGTPLFSSSALRFADEVQQAKEKSIVAVDLFAPLPMLQPYDYQFYGIHALEMIDTLQPLQVEQVHVITLPEEHIIHLYNADGTLSIIRGQLKARAAFQFVTHQAEDSTFHAIAADDFTFYDRLIDAIEQFFVTGESPVRLATTVTIIALLQAIEQSAKTGQLIKFSKNEIE